jgi:tryptophan synthase alpha chain
MNRLETKLRAMRARGDHGIVPYVMAGDGGLERTLDVMRALDEAGAVCIELGLPFSDPIADGPVLQAAADRALEAGTTLEAALDMLSRFREKSALPVVIMTYANLMLRRGWEESAKAIAKAGGDGLIVADLPVEEGADMAKAAIAANLSPIFFVSPTTSEERVLRAVQASRGFVYAIARLGVTGAATDLEGEGQEFLARVRRQAKTLPVAVGFGISTVKQVTAALKHADLAIIGSALAEKIHMHQTAAAETARSYLRELVRGIPSCTLP